MTSERKVEGWVVVDGDGDLIQGFWWGRSQAEAVAAQRDATGFVGYRVLPATLTIHEEGPE